MVCDVRRLVGRYLIQYMFLEGFLCIYLVGQYVFELDIRRSIVVKKVRIGFDFKYFFSNVL